MNSGVYRIRNTLTNMCYVGASSNLSTRFRVHKGMLRRKKHYNKFLQKEYDFFGERFFCFEVLKRTRHFNVLEKRVIKKLDKEYGVYNRVHAIRKYSDHLARAINKEYIFRRNNKLKKYNPQRDTLRLMRSGLIQTNRKFKLNGVVFNERTI